MTPLFFCVRVPEFAAQALVRLRPSLAGTAVAVMEGEPPLEKTCAATLGARRRGVRHGMTRTELESFPELAILCRSAPEERNAAMALLEMAARFTPRTEELPRTSAFTMALDMTGMTRLLGSPQVIGQKLFRAARELGFFVRVAGSRNLHTAACLVRAPGATIIAVPPGQERNFLRPLPLPALALSEELLDTFQAWGLRTAGDLAAIEPADLVARLGPIGQQLHSLACGTQDHLLRPTEAELRLEEYLAFDAPVENLESLLFVLAPMLEQLIERARNRALHLASVMVRLHLERPADSTDQDRNAERNQASEDPLHERILKPALPLDDRALLLKLLQLDLQAHPAPAGVVAITLRAEPGARSQMQSGLFTPQSPDPMRLEVTLARLAALVGETRVGRPVLTDSHNTEAFRMERFTVVENSVKRSPRKPQPPAESRGLAGNTGVALRRLRPAPVVHAGSQNGCLQQFWLPDASSLAKQYIVTRAFGPWRRSGHWWSGEVWSREEWDIDAQGTDGTRLLALLSHDRLRQHWRLEAVYD